MYHSRYYLVSPDPPPTPPLTLGHAGHRPRGRETDRRAAGRQAPGWVDAGRGIPLLLHPPGRV